MDQRHELRDVLGSRRARTTWQQGELPDLGPAHVERSCEEQLGEHRGCVVEQMERQPEARDGAPRDRSVKG